MNRLIETGAGLSCVPNSRQERCQTMIRILSGFPPNVVAIACEGRVTRKDYDDVLVPAVTAALQRHDKVRLYYEITPQFSGMQARRHLGGLPRRHGASPPLGAHCRRHRRRVDSPHSERVPFPAPRESPYLWRRRDRCRARLDHGDVARSRFRGDPERGAPDPLPVRQCAEQ